MREVATSRRQQRRVSKILQDPNNFGKSISKEVLLFQWNATTSLEDHYFFPYLSQLLCEGHAEHF